MHRKLALTVALLMKIQAVVFLVLSLGVVSLAQPSSVVRSQDNIAQNSTPQPSPDASVTDANKTSIVSAAISVAIHWIIVPGILIMILLYAFNLPIKVTDPQIKMSGKAGIFAGLIVFIIFVVSQQKQGLIFSSEIPTYEFSFLAIVVIVFGTIFGYVIAWIVDAIKRYRALGFLVLFIVASTTIAMYGYIFIKDVRSVVVFTSLGIMLGALVHIMWFPEAMSKFSLGAAEQETPAAEPKGGRYKG